MGMTRSKYIVSKVRHNTNQVSRSMSTKELYGSGKSHRKAVADKIRSVRKSKNGC